MEKDKQLNCVAGAYSITIQLQDSRLLFRVSSELSDKEFQGELTNDTLPSWLKETYGDCSVSYELLGEIVAANGVTVNNNGELKFTCIIKMGRMEVKREIIVNMTETAVNELERLRKRVGKLEELNEDLRKFKDQSKQKCNELEQNLHEQGHKLNEL